MRAPILFEGRRASPLMRKAFLIKSQGPSPFMRGSEATEHSNVLKTRTNPGVISLAWPRLQRFINESDKSL